MAATSLRRRSTAATQAEEGEWPDDCRPALMTVTQPLIRRQIRRQLPEHLYYETPVLPGSIAIYTLSDPRDLRQVRYVGQSIAPRRRYTQHVSLACPWIGDHLPWWIKAPRLRPLHEWIRALHRDEWRLPVMVVRQWCPDTCTARAAERGLIQDCLSRELPLLNFEAELLARPKPVRAQKRRKRPSMT